VSFPRRRESRKGVEDETGDNFVIPVPMGISSGGNPGINIA